MDEIRIGYFLEDIGHEHFLTGLVHRVAQERGVDAEDLIHDVRNATGGRGRVLSELRRFLRDVGHGNEQPFTLLVIAVDGNCRGYNQKRREINDIVNQSGYAAPVVCAIPDPHIERWYLLDTQGLRRILEIARDPVVPRYKCERGRYKRALRDAIRQTGVIAPLGGQEYGRGIAGAIDLYVAQRANAGFNHFVTELRQAMAPLARTRRN